MKIRSFLTAISVLVVTALAICVFAFLTAAAGAQEQDVTVNETTISGDPAAANGVSLRFGSGFRESAYWIHDVSFTGDDSVLKSGTSFYSTNPENNLPYTSKQAAGLDLYADSGWTFSGADIENSALSSSFADSAEKLMDDMSAAVRESDENMAYVSVKLSKLLKYYIIGGQLSTDTRSFYMSFLDSVGDKLSLTRQALVDLNNFFKIPVFENEVALCQAFCSDSEGNISFSYDYSTDYAEEIYGYADGHYSDLLSSENEPQDPSGDFETFNFNTISACTGEAIYFTFDPRGSNGTLADTSLIPGGYGIYRLPYSSEAGSKESPFRTDELETVFSLDPEKEYTYIFVSPDEEKLFLVEQQDDCAVGYTFDISTMQCEKSERIMDTADDGAYITCLDEGGCLIFTDASSKVSVFSCVNGVYSRVLEAADAGEALELFLYDSNKFAYDGERLVAAGYTDMVYEDAPTDFFLYGLSGCVDVAVLCDDSLVYYGRLSCNLMDFTDSESYSRVSAALKEAAKSGKTFTEDSYSNFFNLSRSFSLSL